MRFQKLEHIKAGEPITADFLNAIAERLEMFANLNSGSPYIRLVDSPYGKSIALAFPQQTWAKLSGSTSPYSFVEVRDGPGGTWVTMPNGDSGTNNVYEVNGKSGLNNMVVPIRWSTAGDWRFQWVGYGATICTTGSICVTVDAASCGLLLSGVKVTIKDDAGTVLSTCVTSGAVTSVTLNFFGSGYTNGTGYALGISGDGSGATGTFDVVAGKVTNVVITNGGSGYTSATITFPGAGGSGASASAIVKARCCYDIPLSGTYTVVTTIPGIADKTTTIAAVCGAVNYVNVTYTAGTVGKLCFSYTYTDGYSPTSPTFHTLPYSGVTVTVTSTTVGLPTGSATSGSDGLACMIVGAGAYTYSASFPLGMVLAGSVSGSVTACTTKNVDDVVAVIKQRFRATSTAPMTCDCNLTIRNGAGTTCASGTLTIGPDGLGGSTGNVDLDFSPEILLAGSFIDIVWPSVLATQINFPFAANAYSSINLGAYTAPMPCADPP